VTNAVSLLEVDHSSIRLVLEFALHTDINLGLQDFSFEISSHFTGNNIEKFDAVDIRDHHLKLFRAT
jgi:hypothetical protein